jgi:diguanylate cyclase (GGDEF)-like protein
VNNIEAELPFLLQGGPRRVGARSLAVLPLVVGGRTIGVFSLRAREEGFFDVPEIKLLTELAGDISFALDHIDKSERLDYLAYHDPLTGLANRTLFFDRVAQAVEAARRDTHMVAVIVMNIDRFKSINDALGRHAGDDLLKQIVSRFADEPKDLIWYARMTADTFAGMIPETSGADEVARRIESTYQRCYGKPYQIGGTELWVSAKAGVALFPNDGVDPETLFKNAEAALKKAKTGGERYLFHTQQMTERVAERLNLENKLRRALEQEEFVLHYQPKVTLDNRRITGVEALIRWNDPVTGLVPPMQFIPLLEETGLILEVGVWALRRAIRDHVHWHGLGLAAPRIAVNVSAVQLRLSDFVEVVRQAVKDGVTPPGIDIEITESVIMGDIEANIEKFRAIRGMGVNISIDDFGTGYSSLAYLSKLPVAEIKIDRSFIITMLQDANTMTLVSTVVALAHAMGLKVVAEGVDQEEQAEVLRRLGCDQMQGYLFSKPVPFEAITALLEQIPK